MQPSDVRLSVCLSVPSDRRTPLGWFAAVGPVARKYRSIATRPVSGRAVQEQPRRSTPRAAASAGSATLSADVGS